MCSAMMHSKIALESKLESLFMCECPLHSISQYGIVSFAITSSMVISLLTVQILGGIFAGLLTG